MVVAVVVVVLWIGIVVVQWVDIVYADVRNDDDVWL